MSARGEIGRVRPVRAGDERPSTRMGVLDLFVVVIGICLAVLAVLALATSQASLRLSERQVQSMQQIYDVDAFAEGFEAELDKALSRLDARSTQPSAIYGELRDMVPTMVAEITHGTSGMKVDIRVVRPDEMASLLGRGQDESLVRGYEAGVHAVLTSDAGYVVDAVFGIADASGYDVLKWNSTKSWDENAQSEQLWLG